MTTSEGVRVFAIGEQDDLDAKALLQQEINPPKGSLDPRLVAVIEDGDIGREASDEPYLLDRQCCTRGGDDILDPRLMHGEHIGIALHEVALIGLGDGALCPVEPIELSALGVDEALGGVEVLSDLVPLAHDATTEGNIASTKVTHREDHSPMEAVEGSRLSLGLDGQPHLDKSLERVACPFSRFR